MNDVLIVGAGPAGLATATALVAHGVRPLVVDAATEVDAEPKATVVSTRSMELLRSWGLAEAVRAEAAEVEWLLRVAPTLSRLDEGADVDLGLPTRAQALVISPERPECVAQD